MGERDLDLSHVLAFLGFDFLNQLHGVVSLQRLPFELEPLSEGSRFVSDFSNTMIFMFGIPVICRKLWHSTGLASEEGSANNSASMSPGLFGGTWGLPEPYEKLSC